MEAGLWITGDCGVCRSLQAGIQSFFFRLPRQADQAVGENATVLEDASALTALRNQSPWQLHQRLLPIFPNPGRGYRCCDCEIGENNECAQQSQVACVRGRPSRGLPSCMVTETRMGQERTSSHEPKATTLLVNASTSKTFGSNWLAQRENNNASLCRTIGRS